MEACQSAPEASRPGGHEKAPAKTTRLRASPFVRCNRLDAIRRSSSASGTGFCPYHSTNLSWVQPSDLSRWHKLQACGLPGPRLARTVGDSMRCERCVVKRE